MLLEVLLVLLLLAFALLWRRCRRSGWTCLVLALLLFFAAGCGPLPAWLLGSLQTPYATVPVPSWAPRNAIVLLGAGNQRATTDGAVEPALFASGRILQAATLYRDCKASGHECMLLVSGGDANHLGLAEAEVYAAALLKLGIAAADIKLEPASMNTWQNAQFSAPKLHDYGAQQVLLVSSGMHLQRAMLYFTHFGVHPLPVRGDYAQVSWSLLPQAWNLALTDLALHEHIGVLRYQLYEALGWNVQATQPGSV